MNDTTRTDEWEAYCDECYYHFWRLRRKNERGWNDGYHIHTGEEAKGLCDLLNNLEAELTAVTEQRDEALSDLEFRRDLYRLQTKTLDDVCEQRDRLAEAMTRIKTIYENPEKRCIPSSSDMYDEAIQSLTPNEL
jgi:hypothetical protein